MTASSTRTDLALLGASQSPPQRERAPAHPVRTLLLTVLALAILLGGLFLWRMSRLGHAQGWAQQALPVAALQVQPRVVPASLDAVGTLTAVQEVTLSPEVAGRVTAIDFDAGSQVAAGVLLVQLSDGPEKAEREAAQAKADFAAVQLKRSEQLEPTGAEPHELLLQHRSDRDQALAAVHELDARMKQKQVRAPFAGELGLRRVNLGQYLNPGDAVATLTALDTLYVAFALPQQDFAQAKPGSLVQVTSDAYPGRTFTARVNAVEPQVGRDTRNVTVQALLANPDHALRPGMYVTASLQLPPQQRALVVPATAIQTSAEGDSVIAIRGPDATKGGKAEIVPVRTGRRIGDSVVITGGLEAGDVVVTEGQLRVQPAAMVKVARLASAGSF